MLLLFLLLVSLFQFKSVVVSWLSTIICPTLGELVSQSAVHVTFTHWRCRLLRYVIQRIISCTNRASWTIGKQCGRGQRSERGIFLIVITKGSDVIGKMWLVWSELIRWNPTFCVCWHNSKIFRVQTIKGVIDRRWCCLKTESKHI